MKEGREVHAYTRERTVVEAIKDRFADCDAVIMADYRGLSVKEMQQLRNKLREAGAELTVYKNSLTEIAMRELAMPDMAEYLAGPDRIRLHHR